jgi:hypothetical protein
LGVDVKIVSSRVYLGLFLWLPPLSKAEVGRSEQAIDPRAMRRLCSTISFGFGKTFDQSSICPEKSFMVIKALSLSV